MNIANNMPIPREVESFLAEKPWALNILISMQHRTMTLQEIILGLPKSDRLERFMQQFPDQDLEQAMADVCGSLVSLGLIEQEGESEEDHLNFMLSHLGLQVVERSIARAKGAAA